MGEVSSGGEGVFAMRRGPESLMHREQAEGLLGKVLIHLGHHATKLLRHNRHHLQGPLYGYVQLFLMVRQIIIVIYLLCVRPHSSLQSSKTFGIAMPIL